MRHATPLAITLTCAAIAVSAQARATTTCDSLAVLQLPNTTITAVQSVAAGAFTPPRASNRAPTMPVRDPQTLIANEHSAPRLRRGPDYSQLPAFCRVSATIRPTTDSDIKIEVWLPAPQSWNGKFEGVGNGGLGGTISYGEMVPGLKRGYATASTDTGHDNSAGVGRFALGHPEKVIDYGYRSTHLTATIGKLIVTHYYERGPHYAYFSGCSQGGQEALMEAQRFPDDYNGIIAGDPDYDQTQHEVGAHLWVISALYAKPDSAVPPEKAGLIGRAVNQACDALDGLRDGTLEDPRLCHFDPAALQCKGADSPSCLTAAQVEAVKKIWDGPDATIGHSYYPGFDRGAEAYTWGRYFTAASPEQSDHGSLGIPFFRYFVFSDPNWDFRSFDYQRDPARVEKLSVALDATDPNLTPFEQRGGKLIHYHGYNDPDVPPLESIDYYQSVVKALGGRPEVDRFYRLFMVPGMAHCEEGGANATVFDMLPALERWVEQGHAPDRVDTQRGQHTHPACPYPQVAQYVGKGSMDEASSFVCRVPTHG